MDEKCQSAYIEFIRAFLDELAQGYFKVRVLFLDKYFSPVTIIKKSRHEQFFTLYYIFITRAFGWNVAPFDKDERIYLRFFLDQLPDAGIARNEFRKFLRGIGNTRRFAHLDLIIPEDGISEIDSREHRIAQAVDLVTGSLGFRMNRLHKVTGPERKRGKRTRAKDEVSDLIRQRLRDFGVKNIGITTGNRGNPLAMWNDPIRLWRLKPKSFILEKKWIKKNAP